MPKKREKSPREEATDAVLLLYLLKKIDPVWGRAKIQKSAFFSELALNKEEFPGPSFGFYRYDKGPFSQELWAELNWLQSQGFIEQVAEGYTLSERGEFLLDLATPDLRASNTETFEIMDDVLEWCRPRTGAQLIDAAYKVKVEPFGMPGETVVVKDIPLGIDIIVPRTGGLEMSADLEAVIQEELAMTAKELEEARQKKPELIHESVESLKKAIREHGRLSQTVPR
jgi:hypothetical protein